MSESRLRHSVSIGLLAFAAIGASIVGPLACTSDRGAGSKALAPDSVHGAYPQVLWMFTVYEVPANVEVLPDGTVHPTTRAKPSGLAIIEGQQLDRAFESIHAIPGAALVATPAVITQPGVVATITSGSQDKAGAVLRDRSLSVRSTPQERGVMASLECTHTVASQSTETDIGARLVPERGALVLAAHGATPEGPMTVVVARPTILRSAKDYPFQQATTLEAASN